MIGNRYGRAMSSRANVVGPEIIDDIDAGAIGHQSAIPKLAGISLPAVVWRLVQHRLAVEADHPHGVPRDAVLIEKTHHSRSEEHTSELQSLMRISYAVLCLNKTQITNSN